MLVTVLNKANEHCTQREREVVPNTHTEKGNVEMLTMVDDLIETKL